MAKKKYNEVQRAWSVWYFKNGTRKLVDSCVYGYTIFQVIDRAFTIYQDEYPNRAKYLAIPK
jgi:hypothetical protein